MTKLEVPRKIQVQLFVSLVFPEKVFSERTTAQGWIRSLLELNRR